MWLAVLGVSTVMLGLSAITLGIYGALVFFIFKRGGKVSAREFGITDLFVASVFGTWFVAMLAQSLSRGANDESRAMTQTDLIHGAYFYIGIILILAIFLRARGMNLRHQFGLAQLNPFKAGATALGLVVAAFPLILWVGDLTMRALGPRAERQKLVQFFVNASEHSERATVLITIGLGVILAPMAEELMFRGYLYAVLKRYLGITAAAILSGAMFAAMHMNLASLPALFILAMCFTVAYEFTGSLLVTISMHALFNLSMLLALLSSTPGMPSAAR